MGPQSTYECEWCVDGLQADGETPCPCQEADIPRQVRDFKRALAEANEKIANYEEVLADKRRLAREIDVALHGEEGAANQPSLCDLIEQARKMREKADQFERERDSAVALFNAQIEGHRLSARDATKNLIRATTAEARAERLEKALRAMLKEHDILSGNYGDVVDPKHISPDRWPSAASLARAALQQAHP